ncbi:MAG TPA: ATP-binding protein [bacterium]
MARPKRLFWYLFLPLLAAVAVTAASVVWFAASSLRSAVEDAEALELEAAARLAVFRIVEFLPGDAAALRRVCGEMGTEADRRITLVLPDGTVACDTAVPPERYDRSGPPPELASALAGRTGTAVRRGGTSGRAYLLVAVPLRRDGGIVAALRLGIPYAAIEEHLRSFRLRLVGVAAATVALGALVSYLFARWLSRPIEELRVAVDRFAAGDLRASLPAPYTAEVAALRDALGAMAVQLHARIEAAEGLERARQDFVGNISHELKTPITTISGYVELLLGGALDDRPAAERYLETIRRQSERMNLIFNDLLVLSQLERRMGAPASVLEQTEVADVVADALDATRERAAEAAVRVDADAPEGVRVRAAPLLLSQAVANLLRNAIAHTEPGGRVRVCVSAAAGSVAITVLDFGDGIAPEHLPRVFERFYRVDPGRSRRLGGSGLGLAIVKHIALAHGGTVTVVSAVGEGSAFTITVPAS